MHPFPSCALASAGMAAALLAVTAPTFAQTTPPIKPGLWQVHSERLVDGKKAPDLSEQFAKLPPAQRAQMEAMLKKRGVDASAAARGDMKICLSQASLDGGRWQGNQGSCKTDYLSRTASSWRWRTQCTEPKMEADGEARFESPERYTVQMNMTATVQGVASKSQTTLTSRWLGADCGSVKPVGSEP